MIDCTVACRSNKVVASWLAYSDAVRERPDKLHGGQRKVEQMSDSVLTGC